MVLNATVLVHASGAVLVLPLSCSTDRRVKVCTGRFTGLCSFEPAEDSTRTIASSKDCLVKLNFMLATFLIQSMRAQAFSSLYLGCNVVNGQLNTEVLYYSKLARTRNSLFELLGNPFDFLFQHLQGPFDLDWSVARMHC